MVNTYVNPAELIREKSSAYLVVGRNLCMTVSTNYISIFHATRSTDICTVGPVLLVPSRILSQQRLIHRSYFRIDCKTCMDTLLRWPGRDVDFFFIRDSFFSNRDCFFQPRLSFSSATFFFSSATFVFHPQLFFSSATFFIRVC